MDLAEILRAHLRPLVLYAKQWDAEAAEDFVHEAFLKLAGSVQQGNTPDNPVSWLYRVVRNLAVDSLRKKRHFQNYRRRCEETAPFFVGRDASSDPESWEHRYDSELLAEKLKTLSREEREVIVAHLWGEQSFREIAAFTGRSFSTVRREFHRGLESLRKKLIQP